MGFSGYLKQQDSLNELKEHSGFSKYLADQRLDEKISVANLFTFLL